CERIDSPAGDSPAFALHIERAPAAIADVDPARGVAALNAAVERIARRAPAQYQWTYKRYSLRPPGSGEDNPYWPDCY
ncbi:MAG: lauroyl acyltransferase, partial [Lysobacter sp.]